MNPSEMQCEYVVVGSGAAGGTLAARLAEAGKHVVLLEAGGDACQISGGDPAVTGYNRLPADYEVPAFHAFSSENEALRWDFFVRHYEDERLQLRDPKYVKAPNGTPGKGILYPRAGTLGGCTAHNAMIFVYPHDSDWDYIAGLTGDASWAAKNMRRYLEVLENCHHRPWYRALSKFGVNPTRHGWNGWLHTERALPIAVLRNKALAETLLESAVRAFEEDGHQIQRTRWALESGLDPNDWRLTRSNSFGLHYTPLTTCNHARIGTRERVRDVSRRFPDRLQIILNALVTRIKFDERNRATGVEYLEGEN
ncbi:MAG: GMC family oxidoreductase, partial [Acidobacteriaceae bacterium]|nr:GMC family oxidoreductase [Acidobacteriaceae bacterium]